MFPKKIFLFVYISEFVVSILNLIGRTDELFQADISRLEQAMQLEVSRSRFLVIGASGSIGRAVTKEIFKRDPLALHVVDISENNMVELVRDVRSTFGYGSGEFKTFSIDCGSIEFEVLMKHQGPYDYAFNLSALKHVRGEKDPYTLMRMTIVNVFNTIKTLHLAREMGAKNPDDGQLMKQSFSVEAILKYHFGLQKCITRI